MQTPEPILSIRNLGVQRARCRILTRVSWTVRPGEHWALLGANGSGKTSLLKSITGYLMPTRGTIELLGRTYGQSDWRELRKSVGLVSSAVSQMIPDSEPALDTVLSGPRAMIGLWVRGTMPDRRAARRVLRQLGCGRLSERPWAVLSQGERQRVLIARALMTRPALLILDEPCAGLDPVAREHFLQFLGRLGRQPACPTLILVTHHIEEIMPVFNRVLLLKGGHVLKSGPRTSVLTSRWMGEAFGGGVRVGKQPAGRCSLQVSTAPKHVV